MKGSEWIESVRHLGTNRAALMQAVLDAVDKGWDVDWPMQPIDAGDGVVFYAAMDYFAIGEPEDYVYVPLDPITAERICRLKGWTFPTKKMAELIFEQADCKVYATLDGKGAGPWGPPYNEEMFSVDRIAAFNERTQNQIATIERPVAALLAGHRKDLVLSNELEDHPGRLAYWGWIREDGSPIQGPFVGITQHGSTYFDYSHGFRAILKMGRVGGIETPLSETLQHETRHRTLCGIDRLNGPIEPLRVLEFPIDDEPWPTKEERVPDTEPSEPPSKRVEVALPTLRLTHPWMRDTAHGEPVIARMQKVVGATADGIFGPGTERKLKTFQTTHGLVADGICGPMTWKVVLREENAEPEVDPYDDGVDHDDELSIAFLQAKSYRWAKRGKGDVDWIVIHTMEAAEHPGTAENVAAWFAGPNHPRASAHYNIDSDSVVQSVREKDVAHHCPGCNRRGIGFEHAGYARQGNDDQGWQDEYSQSMLRLSAQLAARVAQRFDIPIEFVDADGLLAGKRGITYHSAASEAFKKSDHYDPGKHFPLDQYLQLVRDELATLGA